MKKALLLSLLILASHFALVQAFAQAPDQQDAIPLADPPSINAIRSAGRLDREQATAVRNDLLNHRIQAGRELAQFVASRQQQLRTIISEQALVAYREFRLEGQIKDTTENLEYIQDSAERRGSARRPANAGPPQRDDSLNLLTRDSISELRDSGLINAQQAQALLGMLRGLRAQRQALLSKWDREKDELLAAHDLDDEQRRKIVDADRLVITIGDLHRRQAQGAELRVARR